MVRFAVNLSSGIQGLPRRAMILNQCRKRLRQPTDFGTLEAGAGQKEDWDTDQSSDMTAIRYRRSLFTKYTFCKNSPPSFNFNSIPYINLRYYPDRRKVKSSNSITLERSNLALHDSFAVIGPRRGRKYPWSSDNTHMSRPWDLLDPES